MSTSSASFRRCEEYVITPGLTLAGQPQPPDWASLRAEGYTRVINMRSDPARSQLEETNATAAGLDYLFLPLPAYALEPEHMADFHQALAPTRPDERVYLHCRTATRVALLWLLHRQLYDGWDRQAVMAELQAAGYDAESLEVFDFCANDYFERAAWLTPQA